MTHKLPRLGLIMLISIALSACGPKAPDSSEFSDVTIYTAEHILTLDAAQPDVEAVAVKDGLILAVGSKGELTQTYTGANVNTRFENQTIVPGLIDPHVHMTLGSMMYALDFVPPWVMEHPKGTITGLPTREAFLARIAELEAEADEGPLILFGYHNLVQGALTRQDLDKISTDRPLYIWHYSGHDFYLNSAAIEYSKLSPELADQFHGVDLDNNGELTGRIYEDAGLALFASVGPILMSPENLARGFNGYEKIFARGGVTTVAELGYGIFGRKIEDGLIAQFHGDDDAYRLYLVPEKRAFTKEFGKESPAKIMEMSKTDACAKVLPQVKFFTDAAFYSQTMRLKDPGYTGGQSKGTLGLWVTEPEDLANDLRPYWEAGLDIHIHSNGDAAQTSTLSALETLKTERDIDGQRLVLEHAGLMRPEHIAEAARLGAGISAASHYVFYMGDDYKTAIGERVKYISPLRSSSEAGIPVTLHSDAPLAPPMPMVAAGVHMTRATRQGGVSTPSEALTAKQALRAITLDAAWSLGLEDEIGSIEPGKKADFTILAQNPLELTGDKWPDIDIWGVVLGGELHPLTDD